MSPRHSLRWMASLWSLLSSRILRHLYMYAHTHTNEKHLQAHGNKSKSSDPSTVCKQKCHRSLCERPGTHSLNPSILNTFNFHQTRETALTHPSVHCGNLVSLTPSSVCLLMLETVPKPGLVLGKCSTTEPHPQTLFPWVSVSLCSPGCRLSHSPCPKALNMWWILQPLPLKCWEFRHVSSCQAPTLF